MRWPGGGWTGSGRLPSAALFASDVTLTALQTGSTAPSADRRGERFRRRSYCVTPGGADKLTQRMDKAKSESLREEAWANADASVVQQSEQLLQDPQLVGGISNIITRICQADTRKNLRQFKIGLLTRFLLSCLIDADRTDTADSAKPAAASLRQHGKYVEWPVLAALLESKLSQFSSSSPVDLLRKQVSDDCMSAFALPKGIYTLTVPTGGGKTLASLRFALNHAANWGMDRVIYVSPYTSIIDQNAAAYLTLRNLNRDRGIRKFSVDWKYVGALNFYRRYFKDEKSLDVFDSSHTHDVGLDGYVLYGPEGSGFIEKQKLEQVYSGGLSELVVAVKTPKTDKQDTSGTLAPRNGEIVPAR